jgi:Cu(I)/Ag(I) efflux system membrane protein CusA/SilA
MLATGVRTKVGVKVYGADYPSIEKVSLEIESALKDVPAVRSVYAERTTGGSYLDFTVDRDAAARYGLSVMQIQNTLEAATGGKMAATTVEGRRRFTVLVRYPRDYRSDLEQLGRILVQTASGAQVPIGQLAQIRSPPALRCTETRTAGCRESFTWTRTPPTWSLRCAAQERHVPRSPPGDHARLDGPVRVSGPREEDLQIVLLIVFAAIFFLDDDLPLRLRSHDRDALCPLRDDRWRDPPVAPRLQLSVAVWIGYIALYGVAVETGVIMVIYSRGARSPPVKGTLTRTTSSRRHARARPALRPKDDGCGGDLSLALIFGSTGTGSEVMRPITPRSSEAGTSTIHVLLVTPVIFPHEGAACRRGTLRPSGMERHWDSGRRGVAMIERTIEQVGISSIRR